MLCVYIEFQSRSNGERRADEMVSAVHACMKTVCVGVGRGIGLYHCAIHVVDHICIVWIVCVRAPIGNTGSTSLLTGHGDMELQDPFLCGYRTREVLKSIRVICLSYMAHVAAPV